MHSTLAELLENQKSGLLWVTRDAAVRYANGLGCSCTGLSPGRKVWDPDLVRAIAQVVASGAAQRVECIGVSAGGVAPQLKCRVIPGLSKDDAFVLIQTDAAQEGAAFDRLMQVIDLDLREPIQRARGAFSPERAEDLRGEAAAAAPALQSILKTLDSLVELAALWRSGALLENDRIEIWPLLQQVWVEAEPLAVQRSVKVRFVAQTDADSLATLYGSEQWLRRVMQECLEAAIRSASAGGTLHIEHRQLGPRALIVFRDCGVFAVPEAGAVALPNTAKGGAATRPRLAAREQIGLELCRHVLALHGGQLREETEDGVRNFLIDLPTGAPFRADQASIDTAQVQQYARDLAELMSRSRVRRKAAAGESEPSAAAADAAN